MAGEFTKWFNINFAGESREEIDFRSSKIEILEAASIYAQGVVKEHNSLMAHVQPVITTHKWW